MTDTLAPMLAIIGLGLGEIILILLALMMPVIITALVIAIVVFVQKRQNTGTPARSSAVSPGRKRTPWILLGCFAAVSIGAILVTVAIHTKTSTVGSISPSKFLELVDSNRIVEATLNYNPPSPIYEITGIYKASDNPTDNSISRFTVKMALDDKLLDRLEALPNVEVKEQNAILLPMVLGFLPFLILALLGALLIFAVVRVVSSHRSASRVPPPYPTFAAPASPRKCPKCGAQLRPDVPEGLCPACLLQHGIATEGGEPPGTPAFTPPPLLELAKLFPQLEILEMIGQGGMGAVYKARQPSLDRFVALKILAPRSGGDLDFAGRFSREARALAKLSHPNIVAVYDFGQVQRPVSGPQPSTLDPQPLNYFLMEFVDGPNLRQVEQAGKLTPREALQIIPQICAALQFAHDEGIVHRDIKPENVLLDKKGRVKIADFGLAKILGQEADFRLTGARDVMGTPHYMAPEQVEKPQEVDHRADIYSLGVVFYEMLTGELPLGKFDPPSHKVQIDVRLDDVVLRSLANNPDRRYQQVSDVKTELDSIAQTPPQFAASRTRAAENRSRSSSWIGWAIAAAVLVLALPILIGAALLLFVWPRHVVTYQPPIAPAPAYNAGNTPAIVPGSPNVGVDFHCRVLDCDAVVVDQLIPTEKRHPVTNNPSSVMLSREITAHFATIDTNALAKLIQNTLPPNRLVDSRTTVSRGWGQSTLFTASPIEKSADASWRRNFMGNGFLGMHHHGMELEIKVDLNNVSYNLFPANPSAARPFMLTTRLFYEGAAPVDGALVFLVFFTLPDHTDHYLIVSFETTDWLKTGASSSTAAQIAGAGDRALIRVVKFSEFIPSAPNIRFLAAIPSGYNLRTAASEGGHSYSSQSGLDGDLYQANWTFPLIRPPRSLQPGEWKPGQPAPRQSMTLDTPEQTAAERKTLKSQLQALQNQELIVIAAGQPKQLFSITNAAGDVWQGFIELVRAQTNSPFPPALAPPQPLEAAPLPMPANVVRPIRALPSRMLPQTNSLLQTNMLSPEEQTAIIEMERVQAMQESNPISRILPPPSFSPSINPTNGLPLTNPATPQGISNKN